MVAAEAAQHLRPYAGEVLVQVRKGGPLFARMYGGGAGTACRGLSKLVMSDGRRKAVTLAGPHTGTKCAAGFTHRRRERGRYPARCRH